MSAYSMKQRAQDTITAIAGMADDDLRVMVVDFAALLNSECGMMTHDELRRVVLCYWRDLSTCILRTRHSGAMERLSALVTRIETVAMDRQNKHERNWGEMGRYIK